jgi:hypothetical protein
VTGFFSGAAANGCGWLIQHYIENECIPFGEGDDGTPLKVVQARTQPLTTIKIAEVLTALDVPKSQWPSVERVVAKALRSLGWDNKPFKENGRPVRCWRKLEAKATPTEKEERGERGEREGVKVTLN